ncbi:MAG: HhH-GPD family protein [Chloroflexi bacterium]|nr:HhH-GPD family protein [Chloroflexota bacterium]
MLQQTQVDRVVPYYEAFVERFPSFEALAQAQRADVIRIWGGLGYNRRAVHLHELARVVVERHGGELPSDRRQLLALPGIGPYTAGALLSIGFGQDEPALDTNVRRVVARYAFSGAPNPSDLEWAAAYLVPRGRAGDWNQALMDLGSSICASTNPKCLICPLQPGCRSAGVTLRKPTHRPQPSFRESSRYFRGRLLWRLRSLAPGATMSLPEIEVSLAAHGVAEPPAGWRAVGEGLARDGLASITETDAGVRMGLV